ncbi:MAG TPA: GDSL-type esterase/lipase family protein [Verrucomicrobiae bacterium]|jgi:lysophospholipase L1-like esterase|nr:GDSL-type esterase/lipase family protein [Verrucomicrobiae bacterium]
MKSNLFSWPRFFLAGALAVSALGQTAPDVSKFPDPATLPGKGPTNVWGGLAKVWAQRHEQWASHVVADHGAVVFLGDSITQGWNSLSNDFPNLKVANRGIGGDTTRGVLYRLKSDVLDLDPEAIVLLIGTNDVGNGADPDDVCANIKEILARIKAFNPHVPVIVCKVMPRSDGHVKRADKIQKLNAEVADSIKGDPEFTSCDTWSIYADADGNCPRSEFPDLLHPNAVGYAKFKAALDPIIAQLKLARN